MICNRQIYIFFHHKKHQTTQDHRKRRERVKERMRPRQDFCVWGASLLWTPQARAHTYTLIRTHICTRTHKYMHCTLCLDVRTQKNKESLWGHCVISMSLSLVVKTAKHKMLSLHAAVLLPPEQRNHGKRREEQVDDRP